MFLMLAGSNEMNAAINFNLCLNIYLFVSGIFFRLI